MKVAVLMTGHLRTAAENYKSLEDHLFSHYNCDVYCATWGGEPERRKIESLYGDKLKNLFIGDSKKYYAEVLQYLHSDADFAYGAWWANRLRDQWYIVKAAHELIEGNYDAVLRLRCDVELEEKLEITTESLILPDDPEGRERLQVDERPTDHLAFGSPEHMAEYCNIFSHFNDLKSATDISFAEGLVLFYNREYKKLPVEIKKLPYKINNHFNHDFKSFDGTAYVDQIKFK